MGRLLERFAKEVVGKGFGDLPRDMFQVGTVRNYSYKRGSKEILESLKDNVWMFAANSRISMEAASTPWSAYKVKGSRKSVDVAPTKDMACVPGRKKDALEHFQKYDMEEIDHPLIKLLESPNPVNKTSWEFFYATVTQLNGPGECFWMLDRDAKGRVTEIYVFPTTWVTETPTHKKPTYQVQYHGVEKEFPEDDVIWIRRPDPQDPIWGRGSGPGFALGQEIDIDEASASHLRGFFKRGAIPDAMIGIPGATEDELKKYKGQFMQAHRGPGKQHNLHFYSGDMTLKQLSSPLKDMNTTEIRRESRNSVIQLFGLPPEQLGILENANRSTIDASDYLFIMRVMRPLFVWLWHKIQFELLPKFSPYRNIVIAFRDPVPENKEFNLSVMKEAPQCFLINEWREIADRPPLQGGDQIYNPVTYNSEASNKKGEDSDDSDNTEQAEESANAGEAVENYYRRVLNERSHKTH